MNDPLKELFDLGYHMILRSDRNVSDKKFWKCMAKFHNNSPTICGWGATPQEAARRVLEAAKARRGE